MVETSRGWTTPAVALICGLLCAHPVIAATFRRGDANADSGVDTADAVKILLTLFVDSTTPDCLDALDANDDGALDVSDSVYVLSYLFRNGPPPGPPHMDCGDDPTPDLLDCQTYSQCIECGSAVEAAAEIASLFPRVTCVPEDAGSFQFSTPFGPLVVVVCPASEATACGGGQGCGVDIQTVAVDLDLTPPRSISFSVTGSATDLPVDVASIICAVTLPFSVDVSLPLIVRDVGGGAVEVIGLGDVVFDNISVDVSASGGGVCDIIESVKGLIIGELENQAALITAGILGEASTAVIGRVICP